MEDSLSLKEVFIGIDIGGTLAKICFAIKSSQVNLTKFEHIEHLKIHLNHDYDIFFNRFPTEKIEELILYIKSLLSHKNADNFYITGGGAYKYHDLFKEKLNINVVKVQEFESLAKGLDFLNKNKKDSSFFYDKKSGKTFCKTNKDNYPFLLANVGSGVSFLKFNAEDDYERVTGTCVGGGTFLGLANLITGINDFEKLLSLSNEGDDKKVDLFVKDIYGGMDTPHLQLDNSSLAISFGKIRDRSLLKKSDIVLSLLHMIAFNIGQVAYLVAKLYKVDRVYFAGNFIRNHKETMDCINFAFGFFTKKDEEEKNVDAVFLSHDGYLGALGAMLISKKIDYQTYSSKTSLKEI